MKPYISFDFDHTLFDPEEDKEISEPSQLLRNLVESGENVCITTLRGQNEIQKIKELFPNVQIFATNGFDKVFCLCKHIPVPISKHFDDDLNVCVRLLETSIKPVWVRGKWLRNNIDKVEKLDV